MTDSSVSSKKSSIFRSLLFNIAIWLALVSAFLYAVGWSFAYHYFESFHVGLLTLELPKEYYFIYSFWVVKDHAIKLLVFLICFYIILLLAKHFRGYLKKINEVSFIPIILIILLGLFGAGYSLGTITAVSRFIYQRCNDYPAYPRVKVYLSRQEDQCPSEIKQSLTKGCYRLLLQNKNNLFLFYSHKKYPSADLALLIIPITQVQSFKILPHYNSCDEG